VKKLPIFLWYWNPAFTAILLTRMGLDKILVYSFRDGVCNI
jgi:hypothetical protein